jgi:FMN reductase
LVAVEPLIVGIGGTATPHSSTEQALSMALASAERRGGRVEMFAGTELARLPHYLTPPSRNSTAGRNLVKQVRAADGLIIASPGYHGSISGLVLTQLELIGRQVYEFARLRIQDKSVVETSGQALD